ncbi:MAG: citrate lyase subunit alpha [Acidaminococcaceae bacterium]
MKNAIGRDIPMEVPYLKGRTLYAGEFALAPQGNRQGKRLKAGQKSADKVVESLPEVIARTGLKNGMTISFHHHFRNGDYIIKMVMEAIAAKGIKDLTLMASSLNPCHEFLIDYIEDGTVTALETSGLRDTLGEYLTSHPGCLKRPVVIRSHGGRARAIEAGEAHIDVAFMGAPICDRFGNASGSKGKSACGAIGYAMVDAHHADQTVIITDNLLRDSFLYPYSIPQTDVDYVVEVESIGDPAGIASGAIRITKNPLQLKIAKLAAEIVDEAGYLRDGYSLQLGGGGASLAVAQFMREKMLARGIKGGFGIGGATGIFTEMLKEGLFEIFYDTQTFDTTAAASLAENPRHVEMTASFYANPWTDCIVNQLDVVFLSATEVDLDFNANCMTDSNGVLMGASGGHSDTAAGAQLAVIVVPLIRGRLPMIRDRVQTVITPGESIDIIVTERGIAINPKRKDLLEKLKNSNLPLYTIQELQAMAYELVGKPKDVEVSYEDKDVVAVVEYRDGSIIDLVRKPI